MLPKQEETVSQPSLISFRRHENMGSLLVKSVLTSNNSTFFVVLNVRAQT